MEEEARFSPFCADLNLYGMLSLDSWRQRHACRGSVQRIRATRCALAHASCSDADKGVAPSDHQARRRLVLRCTLAPLLLPPLIVIGTDDATTVVNSVLSAYGLPTLPKTSGFRLYDEVCVCPVQGAPAGLVHCRDCSR